MKKPLIVFIILLIMPVTVYASQCMESFTLSSLEKLKKENFEISSVNERNKTAIKLLSCIGYQDPKIRDDIVYEGISYWLRNKLLEPNTIRVMFNILINILEQRNQDTNNFTQPFSALVFSEVIRVDRISSFLSNIERQRALDVSTRYMSNIKDYRAFDNTKGWRHSVAHTADIFLQLSLNKKISKVQLNQLLIAIKTQVTPKKSHFYSYGEPKRLAMAFVYIIMRGKHTKQESDDFLYSIASPTPFLNWNKVYNNKKGLAKLHNTRSFIYSVFSIIGESENPNLKQIKPTLIRIIKNLG